MKGWPAPYLATNHATAVIAFYQGLPKPGTLAPYRLTATAIADLTDGRGGAADRRVAAALSEIGKRSPASTAKYRRVGPSRRS